MSSRQCSRLLVGLIALLALLSAPFVGAQESSSQEAEQAVEQAVVETGEAAEAVVDEAAAAANSAAQSVGDAAAGVAESAKEAGAAAAEGVEDAADRTMSDFLLPLWERFVDVIPRVVKAIGLFILIWIVAILLGRFTTAALMKTKFDNRLASDLGMEEKMKELHSKGTSLEKMIGQAVKWVILLFGVIAFFNALELDQVAGPLESVMTRITEAVPAVLTALAYLAAYWAVGTLLKLSVTRGLQALKFDDRASNYIKPREVRGEVVQPSTMIGRLVFYIVLLFGLPPFLEALGQESAVVPLRDMMTELFAFLPNVVAAAILLFIGRVVAAIVRELVVNFLAAAGGDDVAERFGVGSVTGGRKLTEVVGTIVYFFVLVPILVAAIDALGIQAISDPVKNTLEQLLAAIPLMFVAAIVVFIGYFIATTVKGLVEGFLQGVGFDSLPERLSLGFLVPKKEGAPGPSSIFASFVMVIILLLTAQQALATLQLDQLSELIGGLVSYLPNLLAGLAIIVAALSLGTYVGKLVGALMAGSMQGAVVSRVATYAIYFLGFSMGLNQLGVAQEIITVAVSAVLGGTALALALAFGLGGREHAKKFLDKHQAGS